MTERVIDILALIAQVGRARAGLLAATGIAKPVCISMLTDTVIVSPPVWWHAETTVLLIDAAGS